MKKEKKKKRERKKEEEIEAIMEHLVNPNLFFLVAIALRTHDS